MRKALISAALFLISSVAALAQPTNLSWSVTPRQMILKYSAPDSNACSVQIADMNRHIQIVSATQSGGTVTVTTNLPHPFPVNAHSYTNGQDVVYVEGTGLWDGWHTVDYLNSFSNPNINQNTFTFPSSTPGTATSGTVGVLVNDVNSTLYPGSNSDQRDSNFPNTGTSRTFVIGRVLGNAAPIAVDGNRYSRTLQAASSHHVTLTCTGGSVDQVINTANIPLGDTHNEDYPVDRTSPGQYEYPSMDWDNDNQQFVDPTSGLLGYRTTKISTTPSSITSFQSHTDIHGGVWTISGTGPEGSGSASFTGGTGGCALGDCPLFLSASSLNLGGFGISDAARYANGGPSLDSFTVTVKQVSCSASSCTIEACLTVDSVSCATPKHASGTIRTTPLNIVFGSGFRGDVWQTDSSWTPAIAAPDATVHQGTVNYDSTTGIVTVVGGDPFSLRWGAGSKITIGSTTYTIVSLQNEKQLTIASGQTIGNGSPYTANNFGVLIDMKSGGSNTITIGPTSFTYISSAPAPAPADAIQIYGGAPITFNGRTYHMALRGPDPPELLMAADDGSDFRDLGSIPGSNPTNDWSPSVVCAENCALDPTIPQTIYSQQNEYGGGNAIIKLTYVGTAYANNAGNAIPFCSSTITTACIQVTPIIRWYNLTPATAAANGQTWVTNPGNVMAFNPEYATNNCNGCNPGGWTIAGTVDQGNGHQYLAIQDEESSHQNNPVWMWVFDMGDRSAWTADGSGTGFKTVAGVPFFLHSICAYCDYHPHAQLGLGGPGPASLGGGSWTYNLSFHDMCGAHFPGGGSGDGVCYGMTLTSTTQLPATGTACPANNYGYTGNNCAHIMTTSAPTLMSGTPPFLLNGGTNGPDDAGTNMWIGSSTSNTEILIILVKNGPGDYIVGRAWKGTSMIAHTETTLTMLCGANSLNSDSPAWASDASYNAVIDWLHDPTGKNLTGTTMLTMDLITNGHANGGNLSNGTSVYLESGTGNLPLNTKGCPLRNAFGWLIGCYTVLNGPWPTTGLMSNLSKAFVVSGDTTFAGHWPACPDAQNDCDTHPGTIQGTTSFNAQNNMGNSFGTYPGLVASPSNPFVNVGGQLWKFPGGTNGVDMTLSRKFLPERASVGRYPLVDVSGPSSAIGQTASDSYKYCIALNPGECVSGSGKGDVYVNAPFVSVPYCSYPGIAIQDDDLNKICIQDIGAMAGQLSQIDLTRNHILGEGTRRLGSGLNRWGQHSVFWSVSASFAANTARALTRWADGDATMYPSFYIPPMPASDGVNRSTFIPITVSVPAYNGAATAVIEFGYEDYGNSPFYCTSRQENCVAVTRVVDQVRPFYYETSETYSKANCGSGCTIQIPALTGRVLYSQIKYYASNGSLVATVPLSPTAVP